MSAILEILEEKKSVVLFKKIFTVTAILLLTFAVPTTIYEYIKSTYFSSFLEDLINSILKYINIKYSVFNLNKLSAGYNPGQVIERLNLIDQLLSDDFEEK